MSDALIRRPRRVYMPLLPHIRYHRRRVLSGDAPVDQNFLLQRAQPALSGLMDGSLSTLAPIFAVVLATHEPVTAFFTGLATALGAGVSTTFAEGLSDSGDLTGMGQSVRPRRDHRRGHVRRGVFHTLLFLITDYQVAIVVAVAVVGLELVVLAWLRTVFFRTSFGSSFVSVTLGGAIIAAVSSASASRLVDVWRWPQVRIPPLSPGWRRRPTRREGSVQGSILSGTGSHMSRAKNALESRIRLRTPRSFHARR